MIRIIIIFGSFSFSSVRHWKKKKFYLCLLRCDDDDAGTMAMMLTMLMTRSGEKEKLKLAGRQASSFLQEAWNRCITWFKVNYLFKLEKRRREDSRSFVRSLVGSSRWLCDSFFSLSLFSFTHVFFSSFSSPFCLATKTKNYVSTNSWTTTRTQHNQDSSWNILLLLLLALLPLLLLST